MKSKKPVFNKQYSFYLTQELYDAMLEKAAKNGVKVSVLIRDAIAAKVTQK